jgi:hypothetical protein
MQKRKLAVFLGTPIREREHAPLPTPTEALYSPPNKDGSAKCCGNCLLWLGTAQQRCFLHDVDIVATARMVCAFHVYGKPTDTRGLNMVNAGSVRPEQSGLKLPGRDSVCRTCRWFKQATSTTGTCAALSDADPEVDADPMVQPLARCARWA